jgi:nucleoside-diphosphate-sugar epimerase
MKILFTGGSSFTGYWFIKELVQSGHEVYASFTASGLHEYEGVRAERVKQLVEICTPIWGCSFGDDKFLSFIKINPCWDVLCHHAANVTNYKSLDFDIGAALTANTWNLQTVLQALSTTGCGTVILTGSVFEQNEGVGEEPIRAFSPYGLSKGLTSDVFKYWCRQYGFSLGKFVIPNPFGPFEEPRFTTYLAKTWLHGKRAGVNTPLYVRDNVHISLLALAYRDFVARVNCCRGFVKTNPAGYIETQGAFTQRVAQELSRRLQLPCEFDLAKQTVFDEPKVRVNHDLIDTVQSGWSEATAWDELAHYYKSRLGI